MTRGRHPPPAPPEMKASACIFGCRGEHPMTGFRGSPVWAGPRASLLSSCGALLDTLPAGLPPPRTRVGDERGWWAPGTGGLGTGWAGAGRGARGWARGRLSRGCRRPDMQHCRHPFRLSVFGVPCVGPSRRTVHGRCVEGHVPGLRGVPRGAPLKCWSCGVAGGGGGQRTDPSPWPGEDGPEGQDEPPAGLPSGAL